MIEARREFKTVGCKVYELQPCGVYKCIKHYNKPLKGLKPDWDKIYGFTPVEGFWRNLWGFITTGIQILYYKILLLIL